MRSHSNNCLNDEAGTKESGEIKPRRDQSTFKLKSQHYNSIQDTMAARSIRTTGDLVGFCATCPDVKTCILYRLLLIISRTVLYNF